MSIHILLDFFNFKIFFLRFQMVLETRKKKCFLVSQSGQNENIRIANARKIFIWTFLLVLLMEWKSWIITIDFCLIPIILFACIHNGVSR